MADILVTSPFHPFTLPTQFKAVFNGYIYCGTVDAVDPSVSQVQIYLVNEAGDKVPVSQPLRTNAGGFLVYNGQPAKFVTDSNHSLLVQDSYHAQVWYAPDMANVDPQSLSGQDGSSHIGFIQAGAGAVPRTAQDKMRERVSVLDFCTVVDGVVDNTVGIQNALNIGRVVVFNAGYVFTTSGNEVPPNTHLIFEEGSVLKLRDGANRPALQNLNWQKTGWGGAQFGVDFNITIEGLFLDGNQANQVHTGSGIYAGEYTSGIRFFGVTNLKLLDVTIFQARTFGIWCCAIDGLTTRGLIFDQYMGGAPDNQDGLHINGPARKLHISNTRGTTNDDMIALNANDGPLGANVTEGDITDAIIEGVYPVTCLNGIRLLSASSRMDRIVVRDVVGTTRDAVVNQSPFGLGVGFVGSLTIENIDVRCENGFAGGNYFTYVSLDGVIENVAIRNIKRNKSADERPSILIAPSANIGICDIDGIDAVNVAGPVPVNETLVKVVGNVSNMQLKNVTWFRDQTLAQQGCVLHIAAGSGLGVNNLVCSDWLVTRCSDVVSLTSGILNSIQMSNIADYDGLSGTSLVRLGSATGATTNVYMNSSQTDLGRKLLNLVAPSTLGAKAIIGAMGLSGAQVGLAGNQSITTGAYRKLALASVVYDRMAEFSIVNNRFTNTQGPGLYSVTYQVQMTIPSAADITIAIYVNGVVAKYLPGSMRYPADAVIGGQTAMVLSAGDYVEIFINSNVNITAVVGGSTNVIFERIK